MRAVNFSTRPSCTKISAFFGGVDMFFQVEQWNWKSTNGVGKLTIGVRMAQAIMMGYRPSGGTSVMAELDA